VPHVSDGEQAALFGWSYEVSGLEVRLLGRLRRKRLRVAHLPRLSARGLDQRIREQASTTSISKLVPVKAMIAIEVKSLDIEI
jgi:hypothetical protein